MSERTYPYNDEFMYYDYTEHKYILTPQCILNKLKLPLRARLNTAGITDIEAYEQEVLEDISQLVYEEIYSYSNQNEIQEYIMAKKPSARKVILDAMVAQVQYFWVNGNLDVFSGVDIKKGTKSVNFSDRVLAPRARKILNKNILETGTPLLYSGKYAVLFRPNYEKDNY